MDETGRVAIWRWNTYNGVSPMFSFRFRRRSRLLAVSTRKSAEIWEEVEEANNGRSSTVNVDDKEESGETAGTFPRKDHHLHCILDTDGVQNPDAFFILLS